jgi:hypothetical protein
VPEPAAQPAEPRDPGAPGAPQEPRSVGRAVAVYSGLRLLLFLVVFLLALVVVQETLLALGLGVLGSALLSIPLLKPYRADLNAATAARVERRSAARARLDEH